MGITERKLANGATYHAVTWTGDRAIVLAEKWEPQPWVTWEMNPDGHTYWGHYFATKKDAVSDFNERVRKA